MFIMKYCTSRTICPALHIFAVIACLKDGNNKVRYARVCELLVGIETCGRCPLDKWETPILKQDKVC